MSTSLGDMSYPAPIVYQRINGREIPVKAKYLISGKNVIKFDLGDYDKSEPLVIDPIAMRWATWVNTNSSGDNHGHCIWVDPSDGAIYVVARVIGTTDQITVGAFDTSANGNLEIIIGKYLEPATIGGSGSRVWQTYVGGNGDENPYAMEQGGDGNLYISGYTSSTNFPLIGGPAFSGSSIDQQSQGGADVFVLKINTAGNSIKAAVIGGNSADDSYDLRVATNGDVIVCGTTTSTNLLTLNGGSGASNTNNGSDDALLFRVNGDLSSLIWMRNYGGSGTDLPSIMAQDPVTGDIFVGGHTTSTNFPTTAARQSTRGGTQAGFLQRLTSAGSTVWSSYFSSNSGNAANILCMSFNNAGNELYFGGVTTGLPSSNISTSGVYDGSHNGSNDLYVCRMGLDQTFISSTYVGGSGNEVNMMGLNTDQNDDVYVFGYTNSTNFPVSSGPNVPLQTTNNGSNDKVFFKLESDLSVLEFSTYYGGTGDDYDPVGERGIKFSNCRIYTIVTSRSNNIPLTQGALNTTRNSPTSRYEPGLVVWANPPDLLGNTITSPAYAICAGTTPNDIMGSVPSYVLPTIVRNNSASAYPALGSATTYQWQTSPDSLNWMNIPGATGQNLLGTQLGPIAADTYVRRVIGGDACILAGAADQVVSVRLMKIHATITNVTCNGAENGSISVTSNGLAPFTYAWSNGGTTDMITGLAPGSYTVMITDAAGCSETSTIQISEPPVLTGQTSTSSATCNTANGTASVVPTGGTAPYSYLWSNSATSSMISGVSSGPYTVTVTDAKE
ncbi:MAG TPA: SBBP repeat-containing protein, partial [Flavobacteriales bacterium]|nr:SBBP repeat-containing protein [Flavobacteriales bacterium]